jgi:predicted nucleotidyltransferase
MVRDAVTQVPHNSVACVMVLFMNNDDAGVRDRPSDSVGALDFDRRALDDLCRKFRVRRLDLFGSATTGHFDPARSDVDLLVEFEAMPPSAYAAAYFGLRAAAETLLGRPVDSRDRDGTRKPLPTSADRGRTASTLPAAMISNEAAKYLWDAQRAAERIARFTSGRSFDDYLADEMLCAAVERQFEIIGEALAGLRQVDPGIAARTRICRASSPFAMC